MWWMGLAFQMLLWSIREEAGIQGQLVAAAGQSAASEQEGSMWLHHLIKHFHKSARPLCKTRTRQLTFWRSVLQILTLPPASPLPPSPTEITGLFVHETEEFKLPFFTFMRQKKCSVWFVCLAPDFHKEYIFLPYRELFYRSSVFSGCSYAVTVCWI